MACQSARAPFSKNQGCLTLSGKQFFCSIASAWEIAIKISIGKLELEGGIQTFFDICEKNGINLLPIQEQHLYKLATLPFIHRDPFDRLLIATTQSEEFILISADENIPKYELNYLW